MALARHTAALVSLTLVAGALVATGGVGAAYAADEPVAGGLTSGDTLFPNQGNSGYDALHYDIDLTVDVAVSSTANAVASTTFRDAITFGLLLLFLVVRPQGIFGELKVSRA